METTPAQTVAAKREKASHDREMSIGVLPPHRKRLSEYFNEEPITLEPGNNGARFRIEGGQHEMRIVFIGRS
jgi:hypothetical protein